MAALDSETPKFYPIEQKIFKFCCKKMQNLELVVLHFDNNEKKQR